MRESNIQTLFGKHLKEHWQSSAVFELKLVKGTAFAFDRLAEHQIKALLKAEGEGVYHKIADQTIGRKGGFGHTLKKPFDCLFINSPSYVAICFYKAWKYKKLLLIPIKEFMAFTEQHSRKSARLEELSEIAEQIIEL